MSKRATEEQLSELHALLYHHMKSRLATGEATAAEINVMRQLLKDNHIEVAPGTDGDRQLRDLMADLPYDMEDEGGYVH